MFTKPNRALRALSYVAAVGSLVLAAGCAQTPVSDDSGRATTLSDAQQQARGGRDRGHAGSQLSLGFGDTKERKASVTDANNSNMGASVGVSELMEPQTFIGTIACGPTTTSCIPLRLTVSLHPNGVWRLRASGMDQSKAPITEQGCWHQIGANPNRILLQTQSDTVLTDLSFTSPNQVRINVFNYVSPKLETHLSRQPELDVISELENQTGPICRP